MKYIGTKVRAIITGLLYTSLSGMPAIADDIEIYTGSISSNSAISATANILFVLDTSGSMDAAVLHQPAYDPAAIYNACFDTSRVYSGVNINRVDDYCNGTFGFSVSNLDQFNRTALNCDVAQSPLDTQGSYTDRIAQYSTVTTTSGGGGFNWFLCTFFGIMCGGGGTSTTTTAWHTLNDDTLTEPVDCKADSGVHGAAANDGKPYASDSNGPYAAGSGDSIDWNSSGESTTLYTGHYLNYLIDAPVTNLGDRLSVMKDALTDVVNSASGINIGLMRFSRDGEGGMVVTPMGPIDSTRADFLSDLDDMTHSGNTPLSETFYEAVSYMQGDNVDYGNSSVSEFGVLLSHPDSRTPSGGSRYDSPIISECQKNYIVLLTDGEPTSDFLSSTRLGRIGVSTGCTDNCLDEIALSIGSKDQSSVINGDQNISTFTIGFEQNLDLLKDTAQASKNMTGVGQYFLVDDTASLTAAFSNIVTQVLEVDTTFSSPAVSVNAYNRSTHLNDLFFTLFKPAGNPHWKGNFKKYKLEFDASGDPFIADADYTAAVDASTGFFAAGSRSFWTPSTSPDGPTVGEGGNAAQLTNTRSVYTFSGTYAFSNDVLVPSQSDLTAASNEVAASNADIDDAMLDTVGEPDYLPGTPYRDTLLAWASGLDVKDIDIDGSFTDARIQVGDPLHAEPALVQYGELATDSDGDGRNDPDLVGYVATNDGYLHAVNTIDGSEYFSFIPQEMLPNLKRIFEDSGTDPKSYGLDGNVVAWVNDIDRDGAINGADHVYLYFGVRRGGNYLYSMDVTDRNAPSFRWVIAGGIGDFAELGQTWSTPNVEKLDINGTEKTVLIFGGGNDENQDTASVRTADSIGRSVFIVDAETGQLLWRAGPDAAADLQLTEMDYSIPSRVKPLDIDGNGFIDRLYVADTGGQIFRFDLDEGAALSSTEGGRIADLAGNTAETARRFYYPPDVALIVEQGRSPYLAILAATGYRAHPLNQTIQDRIFMLRDTDIYDPPTTYTTLTESDLYDATDNIINEGTSAQKTAALSSLSTADGWYIDLDDEATGNYIGEKALSEPLILQGVAFVTTYTPENLVVAGNSCIPQAGTGALFSINITDATPLNLSPTVDEPRADRKKYLQRSGIPPSPTIVITEGGTPTMCIGTECEEAGFGLSLQKMYWYEVEQ